MVAKIKLENTLLQLESVYQRRKLYVKQLALLINYVQEEFSKTGNSHSSKSSVRLEKELIALFLFAPPSVWQLQKMVEMRALPFWASLSSAFRWMEKIAHYCVPHPGH